MGFKEFAARTLPRPPSVTLRTNRVKCLGDLKRGDKFHFTIIDNATIVYCRFIKWTTQDFSNEKRAKYGYQFYKWEHEEEAIFSEVNADRMILGWPDEPDAVAVEETPALRELLPNGFYIGEQIYCTTRDNRRYNGTVLQEPNCLYAWWNPNIMVWGLWEVYGGGSCEEGCMFIDQVHRA